MLLQEQREQVVEYGKKLVTSGLSTGTFGNISVYDRNKNLLAISPSGMDYFATRPEDVVILAPDGTLVDGSRKPSSELDLHCILYRNRPDVGAVVHTHSLFATVLSCMHWSIAQIHYLIAYAGREVPCTRYYPFGTPELAEAVWAAMGTEVNACLLGNHGLLAVGGTLPFAFDVAQQMEFVAQLTYYTRLAGGGVPLSSDALEGARKAFSHYRT
ncbi:MAG: class II aldolase/adducin family protein [Oscillospiraceae bacterium]|nr:class II aldolase/adducin family protein [Oscillospiraceae bacterium]MCC8122584.1 class II aldolase/adducin family protein [Oscillospiraceae bacterium]